MIPQEKFYFSLVASETWFSGHAGLERSLIHLLPSISQIQDGMCLLLHVARNQR
jgi:hypothetical protein